MFSKNNSLQMLGECLLGAFLKLVVYFTDGKQDLDSPYLEKLTHIALFATHTSVCPQSSLAVDSNNTRVEPHLKVKHHLASTGRKRKV